MCVCVCVYVCVCACVSVGGCILCMSERELDELVNVP